MTAATLAVGFAMTGLGTAPAASASPATESVSPVQDTNWAAAQPRPGAKCLKAGKTVVRKGVALKCVKGPRGKTWRRVAAPAPAPTPGASPTPATPAAGAGLKLGSWTCNPGTANQFQFVVDSSSAYHVVGGSSGTYAFTGPAQFSPGGQAMKFTGPYDWLAAIELDSSGVRLGMSPSPPTSQGSFTTVCVPT